ncbi:DUF533 domain-containing protein [uncultured Alsobacter sp.]|uniref:tellurite resistance TerB family protein n=1 Tax=uncultured Alsobacter sp. TaxID=1748258 RepID=UPI0025EF1CD5|nr:DUF533 domain-containing protein [uncultured Alsobacter sp.]
MFDAKKMLDALVAASQAPSGARAAPGAAPQGGLGDILGSVLGQLQQGAPGGTSAGGAAGGLGGLLGAVLGQATQGLQGAAQKSGAGPALNDIIGQLSGGRSGGDLAGKLRDVVNQNQFAAGGALGSLAGLFLGSKAGRGLAVNAAKLGGLAMIGGLAYQAWQNYSLGKPMMDLGQAQGLAAPPERSPFGSTGNDRVDQENAEILLRAMIAAAAADGTVDDAERAQIVGGLQQLGIDTEAAQFLDQEFANPATVEDLAAAVAEPAMAAQVYTAARLTIDPDEQAEKDFLAALAEALGLDEQLVAHIDAAAESAKVQV